jgi:hypothetical protein
MGRSDRKRNPDPEEVETPLVVALIPHRLLVETPVVDRRRRGSPCFRQRSIPRWRRRCAEAPGRWPVTPGGAVEPTAPVVVAWVPGWSPIVVVGPAEVVVVVSAEVAGTAGSAWAAGSAEVAGTAWAAGSAEVARTAGSAEVPGWTAGSAGSTGSAEVPGWTTGPAWASGSAVIGWRTLGSALRRRSARATGAATLRAHRSARWCRVGDA